MGLARLMPLDDAVWDFLDAKPDSGDPDEPVGQRRAVIAAGSDEMFRRFSSPPAQSPEVGDHRIDVPGGSIDLRVYRPTASTGLPLHVFLHGGGFWLGSLTELVNDAICRDRATAARCVVVAVDYRLAPEHPFPAAIDDALAGIEWAVAHASEFGADAQVVSVGGISSGANLAAGAALALRDRGGPSLAGQLLEVPPLDLSLQTMRESGVGNEFGITVDEMAWCVDQYLSSPDEALSPLASPLLADDLSGLPPTVVMTAECDPLRLDGQRYAERLAAAGVPVTHLQYPGAVHGSLALTRSWAPARKWQTDAAAAVGTFSRSPAEP